MPPSVELIATIQKKLILLTFSVPQIYICFLIKANCFSSERSPLLREHPGQVGEAKALDHTVVPKPKPRAKV